jgi:hypothetical protein
MDTFSASACAGCIMEHRGDTLVYLDGKEYVEWLDRYHCTLCDRIEYKNASGEVITADRVEIVRDI